jgi:hypothetical protein
VAPLVAAGTNATKSPFDAPLTVKVVGPSFVVVGLTVTPSDEAEKPSNVEVLPEVTVTTLPLMVTFDPSRTSGDPHELHRRYFNFSPA